MVDQSSAGRHLILILTATAIVLVLLAAYSMWSMFNTLESGLGMNQPRIQLMSADEVATWNDTIELLAAMDMEALNGLLQVSKNEMTLSAEPTAKTFGRDQTPIVEILVSNTSKDPLTLFEPVPHCMTAESYKSDGYKQYDYRLSTSPEQAVWCRVIPAGETISVPIQIPCAEAGTYRINFDLTGHQYAELSNKAKRTLSPTLAEASCTFKVKR